MYNNHKLQDQDLQLAAAEQIVELGDNELDSISGGVFGAGVATAISLTQGNSSLNSLDDAFFGALGGGSIGVSLAGLPGLAVGAALSTPKA